MSGLAFFDTDILLYADDASALEKQDRAIRLITDHQRRSSLVISLQVMQEYYAAATRKLGVDAELAQRKVELLARGRVVRLAEADVVAAIELHRLTGIAFWDSLIAHAARLAGATVLFSEDFQHGRVIAGIRVANPFLTA